MGSIWGVHPFDEKFKCMAQEEGSQVNYPIQGNPFPNVGEIRAALKSIERLRFEEHWAPKLNLWQASIDCESGSTLMNVRGVSGDLSSPKDIYFEGGFVEIIVEVLSPFAGTCGHLFVTCDSDSSFFIIGPDVDPYAFIDGGEEDEDDEDG